MLKLDLGKAEEPENKLPASVGSQKQQESSRKTSISVLLTMTKPFTARITANCVNSRPPHLLPEKSVKVKKQQLELDMEQWTGSKLGKEYIESMYCYPAYLTYMQSTSCKMTGWMKHKLESRLPGEISV